MTALSGQGAESSTGPWKVAEPYLKQALGQAAGLYKGGSGYTAPTFDTYNKFSSQTADALGNIWNYANNASQNGLSGETAAMDHNLIANGGIDTAGGYGNLASTFGAISGGNGGITTDKGYAQLLANTSNPAFEKALDAQAGHLTDDINREFSGLGRTGSAAQSGAIANQVGDFRSQALSNEWNQNVANQNAILGGMTNSQNQIFQNNMGALGQEMNALGGQTAAEMGQAGNELSAIAAEPGVYQQGLQSYQTQAQVGAAQDAQNQAKLQSEIDKYNVNNQSQWNRLGAYESMIGMPAGSGSTSTATSARSPLSGLLGGGLSGASLGNYLGGSSGAGWGAGLGSILGLLSGL